MKLGTAHAYRDYGSLLSKFCFLGMVVRNVEKYLSTLLHMQQTISIFESRHEEITKIAKNSDIAPKTNSAETFGSCYALISRNTMFLRQFVEIPGVSLSKFNFLVRRVTVLLESFFLRLVSHWESVLEVKYLSRY